MWLSLFQRQPRYLYSSIEDTEKEAQGLVERRQQQRSRISLILWHVVPTASLIANAVFLYQRLAQPWKLYETLPTKFAGLTHNISKFLVENKEFIDPNRTIQDAAWDRARFNSYGLYVALEEEYAISKGLPHSMRWPWDDSKGVYTLQAAHEMHCVHVVRSVLNDQHDGIDEKQRLWSYKHAVHCLNILREVVMCHADDQPLYTGRLHANVHAEKLVIGNGMVKKCRDWDALVDWANRHSACYDPVRLKDPDFKEIDRYKKCPDGSKPWEKAE